MAFPGFELWQAHNGTMTDSDAQSVTVTHGRPCNDVLHHRRQYGGSDPHKNLVVGVLYGSDPTKMSLK